MNKSLNLAKELTQRNAVPFAVIPGAFICTDQTPAHRFSTVIAPILDGDYCVVLPSRDFFDEEFATAVLTFVSSRESALSIEKPFVLLGNFVSSQYPFDVVAVLSPTTAKQFEHENNILNHRAFVAIPVYRCELSGDESPELLDTIRHDYLPSLDWKRLPHPKVMMAYRNKKDKTSSPPRLTKLATVLFELGELDGAEGSWVDLENYAGRRCRVAWSQGYYTVDFPDQASTRLERSDLIDRITTFVTQNEVKLNPA